VARVELKDSWYVSGDGAALRKRLLRFLKEQKMKVVSEEEGEFQTLSAAQGSQVWTRLLGGWFVSPATLPKEARVTFTETAKGLRVRATIEETLGFGLMDPILAKKYERFFEDWMGALEEMLAEDGPAPKKAEDGIREKPTKKRRTPD
jgi:hypothetical protein